MIWVFGFLFVVCVLLPLQAWISLRRLASAGVTEAELPGPGALAAQTLVLQVVVLSLALVAAAERGNPLTWFVAPSPLAMLSALALLVALIAIAVWEARRPLDATDALRALLRRARFTGLDLLVTSVAAVAEELAYRGVLFGLLSEVAHPGAAAVLAAGFFGLAHLAQGWRGAALGMVFGLSMQALYALGGSLLVPVATHLLYDLAVGWIGRRLSSSPPDGVGP